MCMYTYIYIYIYRERERERDMYVFATSFEPFGSFTGDERPCLVHGFAPVHGEPLLVQGAQHTA